MSCFRRDEQKDGRARMQTGLLEKSFGVGARVVAGRSQVDTELQSGGSLRFLYGADDATVLMAGEAFRATSHRSLPLHRSRRPRRLRSHPRLAGRPFLQRPQAQHPRRWRHPALLGHRDHPGDVGPR